MKQNILYILLILGFCLTTNQANAQFDPIKGCVVDANGNCLPNTILSAMPFLRIIPDARAGAMGDLGLATSVDPNAMHFNSSKLAFVDNNIGLSATYTPWLRDLGLTDVYLTYLTGYKRIDKLSTVGFGLRFFSLGEINFTDDQGNSQGTGRPRELEVSLAYARKLGENFSAGLTAKYIYSNLASGQEVAGILISSANAFAADISLTYKKDVNLGGYDSEWTIGYALTNVGTKVTYTQSTTKDFLPMNMGLGTAIKMNFDDYNSISFGLDINKLVIPSPISSTRITETGEIVPNEVYDTNNNDIGDYREKSMFSGLIGSFGDAQGGASEEFKELNYSFGAEYWYDNQFAVRAGYYFEHPEKGDRNFLTVGVGLKYNVFGLNLSYLVPTNNRRNPLDNTLRFTLNFDLDAYQNRNN